MRAGVAIACALLAGGCGATAATLLASNNPPYTAQPTPSPPYGVGERIITFVDYSRHIRLPDGSVVPRTLQTIIRYPACGPRSEVDVNGARIAPGRFPLVIFGHGFAVTPYPYRKLLRSWASAGFIVAAPVFPLENANAPGGPNESDLIHQPRDMSFVITQMLRDRLFNSSIVPGEVAVSGQSDGAMTALATAYDSAYRDSRVRAAVVLSGAELPYGAFTFPAAGSSPPLLASQGTADTINLPFYTYQFFNQAPRPKFLLQLLGAHHLPPYTYEQPQLGVVERVSIAFLDLYLTHDRRQAAQIRRWGNVGGVAALTADP
ncbi:MAG TPA: hypothetical protein VGX45_13455 [Solirubrobacteraceae bacterium]|nr:hypothetical protein [Solirubrobacteraceae bacterium]